MMPRKNKAGALSCLASLRLNQDALLQRLSGTECRTDLISKHDIVEMNWIICDRADLPVVGLSILAEHALVTAHVDDASDDVLLAIHADQLALHGKRELVDERCIHPAATCDAEARPCDLVRGAVAAGDAYIVAGYHLVRGREAQRERLALLDVPGRPVALAETQHHLVVVIDGTPGRVHRVGRAVLVVCADDQHRLWIDPGLDSEILSHDVHLLMEKIYQCITLKATEKERVPCRWLHRTPVESTSSREDSLLLGLPLLLVLLLQVVGDALRDSAVLGDLHRELGLTLGEGAQDRGVAEHLGKRDLCDDRALVVVLGRGDDHASSLVDRAEDVALELAGAGDLDLHDRLEDGGLRLLVCLLEGSDRSGLERHVAGVDGVPCTIVDDTADTDDGEADLAALLHSRLEALVTGGDVLGRNRTALDLVDELVVLDLALARLLDRLDVSGHAGILSRTTGLLLVGVVELRLLGDGLAVCDLRLTDLDLGLVLPLHPLDVDVEVQLAHSLDDCLGALGIDIGLEGRILLGEAVEGLGHVVRSLLVDRLDCKRDDRVGDEHARHGVVQTTAAERIAGSAVDAEESGDLTASSLVDVLHRGGMHLDKTSDAEALSGAGVVQLVALLDLALVDADVCQLAELSILELEGKHDGRKIRIAGKLDLLLLVVQIQSVVVDIGRTGQIVDDCIEQGLDALVLVCRAHEDGAESERDGLLPDDLLDQLDGDILHEHGLHQLLAVHGDCVQHLLPLGLGLVHELGGDLGHAQALVVGTGVEVVRLHLDQVDDALELVLESDGDLHEHGVEAELLDQLVLDPVGVGAASVALVDERDAGDMIPLHLAVDGDGLGLDAADGAQHEDGAVEDAQRPLDLDREVDVARSVDDVDFMVLPVDVGGCGCDGDSTLPLELHGVHGCTDAVLSTYIVDCMDLVAVVENALAERSLSRVDMSTDTDVSHIFEVVDHIRFLSINETHAWVARRTSGLTVFPKVHNISFSTLVQ